MATTPDAITDQMISLVEDITPALHAVQKFRAHREEMDFRDWALASPASCLRRFSITFGGDTPQALVTSGQLERTEETVEVVVAYPTDFRHGGTQLAGLRKTISRDAKQIEAAIGVCATDTTLKSLASIFRNDGTSRESAGPVHFGVITFRVEYARSLA